MSSTTQKGMLGKFQQLKFVFFVMGFQKKAIEKQMAALQL